MPDLDAGTRDLGKRNLDRLVIEARQPIFHRAQSFGHLLGQELLGSLLRLGDGQRAFPRTRSDDVTFLALAGGAPTPASRVRIPDFFVGPMSATDCVLMR